jgi:hypothetical protein
MRFIYLAKSPKLFTEADLKRILAALPAPEPPAGAVLKSMPCHSTSFRRAKGHRPAGASAAPTYEQELAAVQALLSAPSPDTKSTAARRKPNGVAFGKRGSPNF